MNEEKAKEILLGIDPNIIQENNTLYCCHRYICSEDKRNKEITLDDEFTLEELEAIVWWMKNKA